MKRYFHNILVSLDQFFNTVFGGDPDETVSSRLGKAERAGSRRAHIACAIIGLFLGHDHCHEAIEE